MFLYVVGHYILLPLLNNCLKPLDIAKNLLIEYNFDYINVVAEFMVVWFEKIIKSDLSSDDLDEIYDQFKNWLREYRLTTKLVNLPLYLNIVINIFVKLVSINKIFFKIAKKLF